tara:strand:+ start:1328 stop:1906 length:579 start_codon:yes stop_codon:yes gene_type:complete
MGNYILCYDTGSGVIERVVNMDIIPFDKCGVSPYENKVSASSDETVAYYLGSKRFSGSAEQLYNGTGTLVDIDEIKWSINGQQISSSMDVSIPSDTSFNLQLEVIDGQTNSKSTLSGDGFNAQISVKPIWFINSVIGPDDEDEVDRYDKLDANIRYQSFTNGEVTRSVDLSSDGNRVYLFRGNNINCNLIKD